MRPSVSIVLSSLVVAFACVTINVYFPEEEIRDLSQQIEEEVRRQAEQQEPSGSATEEQQQLGRAVHQQRALPFMLVAVMAPVALQGGQAEVPPPQVTNPAIRKIIDSRAERLPAVNRLKAAGVVGESNQALLEIRNLQALADLRARAEAQRVVKEENADRELLFKEVARATGVEMSQLPQIRRTYAETMRRYARAGEWIQLPDGTWTRAE